MRVLFDTNVLFSALVAKGVCEDIVDLVFDNHTCLWSVELRDELIAVLRRKSYYDPDIALTVREFPGLCEFVVPSTLSKPVSRDPDDDVVLATALAGRADYIVTGDDDLLVLKTFHNIGIITPRDFWKLIVS